MTSINISKITTITFVTLLTLSAILVALPITNATVSEIDTSAYIIIHPNPVGINQAVLVTFGIDKVNPFATISANNWEGLTVKITKPNGDIDNMGPYTAYAMANYFFSYVPDQLGTYTFEGTFPGQWVNGSYRTTNNRQGYWTNSSSLPLKQAEWWYKPSSVQATLEVQQDPILGYAPMPLPTDQAWRRPLNPEIKGWGEIADNWLMPRYDKMRDFRFSYSAFAPLTSAPNSPHILWTKPITFGGAVGGAYGDVTYRTGLSYEPWYSNIMILNGRIIYTVKGVTTSTVFGTRILDLYTGEEIMYLDDVDIDLAQIYRFDSPNEHGALTYLWDITGGSSNSTWYMYDAFEGEHVLTITNVTGRSDDNMCFGPRGEILFFALRGSGDNRRLRMWNSSKAILTVSPGFDVSEDIWNPPYGVVVDGKAGIEWEVSVPYVPGEAYYRGVSWEQGVMITTYTNRTGGTPFTYGQIGYDIHLERDSVTGEYPTSMEPLWRENRTMYTHREGYSYGLGDVFAFWDQATRKWTGYSVQSGQELWQTDPVPMGWGTFTAGEVIGYGRLYAGYYDGHVRAWNATTGELDWDFYFGDAPYLDPPYGSMPAYGFTVADGKLFVTNDEHSPDAVQWRGGSLWAIDAETGELLWKLGTRLRHTAVSDGIITAISNYDMRAYTIGKGPSKTTVSAPQTAQSLGTAIMITGSVLDMSPGAPNTPAISDEDMNAWMQYLYMQKPKPENVKGVTVKLSAIDPNGNYQDIGEVTSDSAGNFGKSWKPPVPGDYFILAEFEGTESYGFSYDTTYLTVSPVSSPDGTVEPEPSPSPSPSPGEPSPSPSESPSPSVGPEAAFALPTEIVMAAAVAVALVVAIGVYWVIRKRR